LAIREHHEACKNEKKKKKKKEDITGHVSIGLGQGGDIYMCVCVHVDYAR
jgi:hypothetical protein